MDDAKEFLASLLKTMRDRLGNPLVSAFAIAWAVWNFRVILVLVGDGEGGWLAKINYLDKQLMVPSWMWGVHGLLIPLLIAGVWIFVLPVVLRKVAVFHEQELNKTRGELITALESTPISTEDRSHMWAKIHKERKAWADEREELLKAVAQLETQATTERSMPNALPKPASPSEAPQTGTPQPESPNLFHTAPALRARALNLNVSAEFVGSRDLMITFVGHQILWPWMLPKSGLSGLSDTVAVNVRGMMFSEHELWFLFKIRGIGRVRLDGVKQEELFEFQSAVDQLHEARLIYFSEEDKECEINAQGRLFIAWLLRVGFEFNELAPSNKKDKKAG